MIPVVDNKTYFDKNLNLFAFTTAFMESAFGVIDEKFILSKFNNGEMEIITSKTVMEDIDAYSIYNGYFYVFFNNSVFSIKVSN